MSGINTFDDESVKRISDAVRKVESQVGQLSITSRRRHRVMVDDIQHPFIVSIHDDKADVGEGPIEIGGRGWWWFPGQVNISMSGSGWLVWQTLQNFPDAGTVVFQTVVPDPQNVTYFLRTIAKITASTVGSVTTYSRFQCQLSGIDIYATV